MLPGGNRESNLLVATSPRFPRVFRRGFTRNNIWNTPVNIRLASQQDVDLEQELFVSPDLSLSLSEIILFLLLSRTIRPRDNAQPC